MKWITWLGVVAFLMGIAGSFYGANSIFDQYRRITTCDSVDAVVVATLLRSHRSQFVAEQACPSIADRSRLLACPAGLWSIGGNES